MTNRTVKIVEPHSNRTMMVEPDAAEWLAARGFTTFKSDGMGDANVTAIFQTMLGLTLDDIRSRLREHRTSHGNCTSEVMDVFVALHVKQMCKHYGTREGVIMLPMEALEHLVQHRPDDFPSDMDLSPYIDFSKH